MEKDELLYNPYNHMIHFIKSIFDWQTLAGLSGSVLGFVPSLFLSMEPFTQVIQILSGTGGVAILSISIYQKIIEAKTQYLEYKQKKREVEKEIQETK